MPRRPLLGMPSSIHFIWSLLHTVLLRRLAGPGASAGLSSVSTSSHDQATRNCFLPGHQDPDGSWHGHNPRPAGRFRSGLASSAGPAHSAQPHNTGGTPLRYRLVQLKRMEGLLPNIKLPFQSGTLARFG